MAGLLGATDPEPVRVPLGKLQFAPALGRFCDFNLPLGIPGILVDGAFA